MVSYYYVLEEVGGMYSQTLSLSQPKLRLPMLYLISHIILNFGIHSYCTFETVWVK